MIKICRTLKVFQNITAGSNNFTNVTLPISYIRNVRKTIITTETLYCTLINTHVICLGFLRTMVPSLYVAATISTAAIVEKIQCGCGLFHPCIQFNMSQFAVTFSLLY